MEKHHNLFLNKENSVKIHNYFLIINTNGLNFNMNDSNKIKIYFNAKKKVIARSLKISDKTLMD